MTINEILIVIICSLYFNCLIVLSLPSKSIGCGKQLITPTSRVVGGNDSYDGEFPWAVSIRRNGGHHCGGVIIAKRWILTAAHCVQSKLPSHFVARIGEYRLHRQDYHSHDYSIEKVVIHDDYNGIIKPHSQRVNSADIALLKTHKKILFSDYTWPVCVPSSNISFAGQEAIVIGWGKKSEKSDMHSDILQKAKLFIIDNKICQSWYKSAGRSIAIHDEIICAGYQNGGKDACHGDSGGPLLSKLSDSWAVIGIVSTGIGCARPLLPGLYSRVSSYVDWIARYLSER